MQRQYRSGSFTVRRIVVPAKCPMGNVAPRRGDAMFRERWRTSLMFVAHQLWMLVEEAAGHTTGTKRVDARVRMAVANLA